MYIAIIPMIAAKPKTTVIKRISVGGKVPGIPAKLGVDVSTKTLTTPTTPRTKIMPRKYLFNDSSLAN